MTVVVHGQELLEAMIDVVVVLDLEGKIVRANSAAEQLSGYSIVELRQLPVARLFVDALSGVRTRVRQQIAAGHAFQREESWLVTSSGQQIPVSIAASPVIDDRGQVNALLIVARDAREMRQLLIDRDSEIARRQAAEEQLRSALTLIELKVEQMRQLLLLAERRAMLGTLAGGVGHELRNIAQVQVNTIDTLQQAIHTGDDLAPPVQAVLHDLERVSDHLLLHANHLLNLAKPSPAGMQRFAVDDLVRDVVAMLRSAGKLKGIDLEVSEPDPQHVVFANRARIEQVLINLIVNGVEAITSPGTLSIHVHTSERVEIEVRDTGCGIPSEMLERVFDPYFTTKGRERGIGLGLSIVRDIVESYGGCLRVQSAVGVGTTFRFDLPQS